MQVARAMELTADERRRLEGMLAFVPLAKETAITQAMWQFVSDLPDKVQQKFKAAWPYRDAGSFQNMDAKVSVYGMGPTIGFPLSQARIAEVAFCPLQPLAFYDGEAYKFGPWWSIALWPREDDSHTQHGGPRQVSPSGWTILPWPRLSLQEVDALVARVEER